MRRFPRPPFSSVYCERLRANSVTERGFAAPANEHAVLVDNIGTYGRKISTPYPR
jgi:hypothetical protein